MNVPEFASLQEVAKAIGISRASAYTWALSGRIPAQLIAGRYLVLRSNIPALVRRERKRARPRGKR